LLVNGDPENAANWPAGSALRGFGFGGVRLVSRRGIEPEVAQMQAEGMFVLAVVNEQSQGYLVPGADLYQIGNEPDIGGTADSMRAQDFVSYLQLYRNTYPDLPMITAGLATADSSYLQRVRDLGGLNGFSGVAVHYPASLATISNYRRYANGLPIYVTEFNTSADRIVAYKAMMQSAGVALSAWFSWGYDQWALSPQQARALLA
jgi:hypothetical protein